MNLRRVAPIAIATALALLSTPADARQSRSGVSQASQQTATTQPTGGAQPGSGQSGTTVPSTGDTSGVGMLLPIPPSVDSEIAAVLENERKAAAVADAEAAAAVEVAAAEAIVASTQGVVDQAHRAVADATSVVADRQGKLDAANELLRQATARADAMAEQAVAVGVSMYIVSGSERDPRMGVALAVLSGANDIADESAAKVYRDAVANKAFNDLGSARDAATQAKKRVKKAEDVVEAANLRLRSAAEAAHKVEGELAAARKQVADTKSSGARQVAKVAAEAPSLKSTELTGGLEILGDPLVSAKDLAAFVRQNGRANPSIDLDKLAEAFIAEGKAEGVRSDVAWVQSIIETGWFSFAASMVRPDDYNYAGIGACDSCSRGIIFKSMEDGVRSQIQLLRTYATKGLKTADLSNPPPRLVPERSSVRGCCETWMRLSGVWATGPGYGVKILTLYNQLLSFAASQRLA
ncbi:MAG: glucosaminidase domain-containing protein [Microthrixaceae bacterium]